MPKPFLKWVGGKGKLASQLKSMMPPKYGRFYEPFVGGGALFFSVEPKTAFINDINKALMGAYKNIKERPEELIDCLRKFQEHYYSLNEDQRKEYFYNARDEYNSIKDPGSLRKSCLLIFLNRTCYNGMYRENSKGGFNVPFGNYKQPLICDEDTIKEDSKALKNTQVSSVSFEKAVSEATKGDFVYFDPPYYPLTKTANFTSYSEFGFLEKDQLKLKRTFDKLARESVYVMLSNSSSKFIKDLYKDYRQETVYAARAINSKGEGRGKIEELVILGY